MTIGEVWLGLKRYQPFIFAVLAIVLVVWFLPGKPSTSNSNLTNGSSSDTSAGQSSSGGSQAASGGSSSATGPSGAGGGGSRTARGVSGTSGGASIHQEPIHIAVGADQYCDKATNRLKFPTLYAP